MLISSVFHGMMVTVMLVFVSESDAACKVLMGALKVRHVDIVI